MANFNQENRTSGTASTNPFDFTPKSRMPENHSKEVIRPANFTLAPTEQKKVDQDEPSGLLTMRVSIIFKY